jgi:hypothetical protein
MPRGRPHLNVPRFTQTEIDIAQRCALSLWNGVDYENGKDMEASDAEFLAEYALACEAKRKNPQSQLIINETALRKLIRVGKLKAMFRSTNPLDFANGLVVLKAIITEYDNYLNGRLQLTEAEFAEKISLDLAKSFVTFTRIPTINGNYRLPFASRILAYGFPTLPIFNFSNGLASKMHFQSRPQAALPNYYRELDDGLVRTQSRLSSLVPPSEPAGMSQATWQTILLHGWWQRRVLDIALLLRFGVTTAAQAIAKGSSSQAHKATKGNSPKTP